MEIKEPVLVTVSICDSIKVFHFLTEDLLWSQIPIKIIIATAKIPTAPSMISRLEPDVTAGKAICRMKAITRLAMIPVIAPP